MGRDAVAVIISEALQARLDALPEPRKVERKPWTPEEDAALLKYWPIKRHSDVAKALGRCENICRYRLDALNGD